MGQDNWESVIRMKNNEMESLSHTLHKNKLQMHSSQKREVQNCHMPKYNLGNFPLGKSRQHTKQRTITLKSH